MKYCAANDEQDQYRLSKMQFCSWLTWDVSGTRSASHRIRRSTSYPSGVPIF